MNASHLLPYYCCLFVFFLNPYANLSLWLSHAGTHSNHLNFVCTGAFVPIDRWTTLYKSATSTPWKMFLTSTTIA